MPGFEIFGDEERKEVQDVLETGVLFRYGFDEARKGQWKAKTFEEELSGRLGIKHCHLCSSGTAALSIALASCGIGAGDEVIVPPFTFVATMEAVLLAGAIPVFAEIDDTLCLDPGSVQDVITKRTKAVLPVHMCGSMARIDDLSAVCESHGLMLIEDACQALGATFHGKAVGTFGRIGCFSFDSVKTVTCGEGGAVVTDEEELYLKADAYGDHGHDHMGNDRGLEGHAILGSNYRISELNAAVGLAQLRKLDFMLERQREHKSRLKEALSQCSAVRFRSIPDETGDSATFLSFFLPDEEKTRAVVKGLGEAGVDGTFYWYDNKWHYFRKWEHLKGMKTAATFAADKLGDLPDYLNLSLPKSDRIISRTISMLIKLSWTQQDVVQRIEKINGVLNKFF